jgi:integrating conjugative element protein (TIGR03759 family)
MKKRSLIALSLVLSVSTIVDAGSKRKDSENILSGNSSSLDMNAMPLITEHERTLAKQWMLKETDWVKYKQLMSGPRGIWSPGLDPITALGVSETDEAERKRYAELWIKIESRRAELELAFEVERQIAAKKILGNKPLVNNAKWIKDWEKNRAEINEQILLFVDVDCKEECKDLFDEIYASVAKNARLDIYFVNDASTSDIGKWAAFMKIPPEVVRSKTVTLNFDDGESSKMNIDTSKIPQVRVVNLKTGETTATYK